jgi:hypothetical protein
VRNKTPHPPKKMMHLRHNSQRKERRVR